MEHAKFASAGSLLEVKEWTLTDYSLQNNLEPVLFTLA